MIGTHRVNSLRQPADKADLSPGFAALTAVGKKILRGAACAGTHLKELVSRNSCRAEDVAVQPAQIDERLAVPDGDARGGQLSPSFHQRPGNVVSDFITADADRWSERHFQLTGLYVISR